MISVIVPTHNRAHLLPRAVQSVLAQTYQDFELILVDDTSTDNTCELIESMNDPRIRYIRHEVNRGGAAARNTGIRAARGDYIAFLDDDDEWLPDKLQKQIEVFSCKDQELGVVICGSRLQSDTVVRDHIPRPQGWVYENRLAFQHHTTTSTILARRACLEQIGGFDETFPAFQEWDLLLRLSKKYQFDHVGEVLHIYHAHSGVRISNSANQIEAMRLILNKHADELTGRPKILAQHNYKLARMYMRTGRLPEAKQQLALSLQASPLSTKRWLLYLATSLNERVFGKAYGLYVSVSRLKRALYKRMAEYR